VDKQKQFISGLTGNNPITMPKEELSLQDIATCVTEYIVVARILKNMRNKKIHLELAEALYFLIRNHKREPLLAGNFQCLFQSLFPPCQGLVLGLKTNKIISLPLREQY